MEDIKYVYKKLKQFEKHGFKVNYGRIEKNTRRVRISKEKVDILTVDLRCNNVIIYKKYSEDCRIKYKNLKERFENLKKPYKSKTGNQYALVPFQSEIESISIINNLIKILF